MANTSSGLRCPFFVAAFGVLVWKLYQRQQKVLSPPKTLEDAENPLVQIKLTVREVLSCARHVQISAEGLHRLAEKIVSMDYNLTDVEWDSEGWHYSQDTESFGPLTCQYIFVLDCLNFCFWPTKGLEYITLACSLRKVLERDPTAFDAERLAVIDPVTLASWLPPEYCLPQLEERCKKLREVGCVLKRAFFGKAAEMVKQANNSAAKLVRMITAYFPGFRDEAIYNGKQVFLYKRAQILVADVWAAYGKHEGDGNPFAFRDIDQLTMFADYRVPQILHHYNVLIYSQELEELIENQREILAGSEMEIELRAATIDAIERLREHLKSSFNHHLKSIEVDWLLWNEAEKSKEGMTPHHRTRTVFY